MAKKRKKPVTESQPEDPFSYLDRTVREHTLEIANELREEYHNPPPDLCVPAAAIIAVGVRLIAVLQELNDTLQEAGAEVRSQIAAHARGED